MRIGKPNIYYLNQFLRNLLRAQKTSNVSFVNYPKRKQIVELSSVLAEHHLIFSYAILPKQITVFLQKQTVPFGKIELLSKPSRYVEIGWKQLLSWKQKDPYSIYIIYTPKGLLSSEMAIKHQVGGFLLCRIGF